MWILIYWITEKVSLSRAFSFGNIWANITISVSLTLELPKIIQLSTSKDHSFLLCKIQAEDLKTIHMGEVFTKTLYRLICERISLNKIRRRKISRQYPQKWRFNFSRYFCANMIWRFMTAAWSTSVLIDNLRNVMKRQMEKWFIFWEVFFSKIFINFFLREKKNQKKNSIDLFLCKKGFQARKRRLSKKKLPSLRSEHFNIHLFIIGTASSFSNKIFSCTCCFAPHSHRSSM